MAAILNFQVANGIFQNIRVLQVHPEKCMLESPRARFCH